MAGGPQGPPIRRSALQTSTLRVPGRRDARKLGTHGRALPVLAPSSGNISFMTVSFGTRLDTRVGVSPLADLSPVGT